MLSCSFERVGRQSPAHLLMYRSPSLQSKGPAAAVFPGDRPVPENVPKRRSEAMAGHGRALGSCALRVEESERRSSPLRSKSPVSRRHSRPPSPSTFPATDSLAKRPSSGALRGLRAPSLRGEDSAAARGHASWNGRSSWEMVSKGLPRCSQMFPGCKADTKRAAAADSGAGALADSVSSAPASVL